MPTIIELQRQLLLAEKKLSAERSALNFLIGIKNKIQSAITRIKSTIETADNKFKNVLTASLGKLEKEAISNSAEIETRNKNIEQYKLEIDRLQKLIAASNDTAKDEFFLYAQKVNALSDKYPVLLFPVKLETRFHKTDTARELWIRVYPDLCQTEVQRQYLTIQELKSVIKYLKDNSFDLAGHHGNNRANFIKQWVQQFANIPSFLGVLSKGDRAEIKKKFGLDILDQIPIPQAVTLPDRFVFRLYNTEGKEARTEIGKQVTKSLQLGFNKENADGAAWMHNFDEAIKVGMGIRIVLTNDEYNSGFSKLIVLGIKTETNPTESQQLLENLIENHFYSSNGLSLLRQGTVTNNSDEEDTSYSWKNKWEKEKEYKPPPLVIPKNTEEGSILFNDGIWVSQYLGIKDELLQKVENAQANDQRDARAMNTALFPATLGYFFNEMMDPLLSEDEIGRIESFFNKYVLGRGTIPTIRIGKQPYGILPVSVFAKLNLQASDPMRNAIVTKVQELFNFWKDKSQLVKHISNTSPISSADFLDILSLHPNSISFQQRLLEDVSPKLNAVSSGLLDNSILGDLNDWIEGHYMLSTGMLQKLMSVGLDSNTQRPDILYKIFTASSLINGPVIEPISDENGLPLNEVFSETEGLKFNYINWLANSDFETIRTETGIPYEKKPLLYLFLRHALLLKYAEAAKMLEKSASGIPLGSIKTTYKDNQLMDSLNKSKTALLYRVDEKITGSKTLMLKDFIRNGLSNSSTPVELINLNTIRSALLSLAQLSTGKLERAFVEHIDCCSYRIDAWINALYSIQIRKQRIQSNDSWSKGIYLGAFAYLEDLKPKDAIENAGYILAPSLAHAASAAILKNAQLTYQGNEKNPFNLNISSEQVRLAIQLLDGIRSGLGLNELLGYRFERKLYESTVENNLGLEKYIHDFRIKYPLSQSQNDQNKDGPQESVSARNVTDGLKVLIAFEANEESVFTGITNVEAEKNIIKNILKYLLDIIDSIRELMMTEGVYQSVYSNYERGAAVLDALGQGNYLPDLEVINTPRKGAILTHRVALHFNYTESAGKTESVRAALEPSINEWLRSVLPDSKDVVVNINKTAQDPGEYLSQKELDIEPIDLLYLMNFDDNKSMTALDDLILGHLGTGKVHSIRYKEKKEFSRFTFFELSTLIRPVRKLIFQSRYLSANDLKYKKEDSANEVNKLSANHLERLITVAAMLAKIDFLFFDNLDNKSLKDISKILSALSKKINTLFDNRVSFGIVLEKLLKTNLTPKEITDLKKEIIVLIKIVKTKLDVQKIALSDIINKVKQELSKKKDADKIIYYSYDNFMADLKNALGENVVMLPQFKIPESSWEDFRKSFSDSTQLLKFSIDTLKMDFPVQDWIGGIARVREKMASVEAVMNGVELIKNTRISCTPLQLPYTEKDRWLALQFASENDNFKVRDKLLYTVLSGDKKKDDDILCGLMADEWTEVVPDKEEKAGVSFQYRRPNAEAPQTMLLVTPPEIKGNWSYEDIADSILSTLDIVKSRAVEPDHLSETDLAQFLPATIMFSPLYDTSVSTNLSANM